VEPFSSPVRCSEAGHLRVQLLNSLPNKKESGGHAYAFMAAGSVYDFEPVTSRFR